MKKNTLLHNRKKEANWELLWPALEGVRQRNAAKGKKVDLSAFIAEDRNRPLLIGCQPTKE